MALSAEYDSARAAFAREQTSAAATKRETIECFIANYSAIAGFNSIVMCRPAQRNCGGSSVEDNADTEFLPINSPPCIGSPGLAQKPITCRRCQSLSDKPRLRLAVMYAFCKEPFRQRDIQGERHYYGNPNITTYTNIVPGKVKVSV